MGGAMEAEEGKVDVGRFQAALSEMNVSLNDEAAKFNAGELDLDVGDEDCEEEREWQAVTEELDEAGFELDPVQVPEVPYEDIPFETPFKEGWDDDEPTQEDYDSVAAPSTVDKAAQDTISSAEL